MPNHHKIVKKINDDFNKNYRESAINHLNRLLTNCSDEIFEKNCLHWVKQVIRVVNIEKRLQNLGIVVLNKLLEKASLFPQLSKSVSNSTIPPVLKGFLATSSLFTTGASCVHSCLKYYYGSCVNYESSIKKYIVDIISKGRSVSYDMVQCFAYLPLLNCSGCKTDSQAQSWTAYFKGLMGTTNSILKQLFDGVLQLEVNSADHDFGEPFFVPSLTLEDMAKKHHYLLTVLNSVCLLMEGMLKIKFPVPKTLNPSVLMQLICKGISVNEKSLARGETYEKESLRKVLPKVQSILLKLLSMLIATYSRQLLPFSSTICRIIRYAIKSSNGFENHPELRIEIYVALCNWLTVAGTGSGVDEISSTVTAAILHDIKMTQSEVVLSPNKHKSHKKKNEMEIHVANCKVTKFALMAIQLLFKGVGTILPATDLTKLQDQVLRHIVHIQRSNTDLANTADVYLDSDCRQHLYSALMCAMTCCRSDWIPALTLAIPLFVNGQNDSSLMISDLCRSNLLFLEKVINPRRTSLYFVPEISTDKNLETSSRKKTKHKLSETNSAEFVNQSNQVTDEDEPFGMEEQKDKKRRLLEMENTVEGLPNATKKLKQLKLQETSYVAETLKRSELQEMPQVNRKLKLHEIEEVPRATKKLKQSELGQVSHVASKFKKSNLEENLHVTKKLEQSELEEVPHVTNNFKQPELEVTYVTNKLKQSELDQVPRVSKNLKKPKLKEMLHGTKKLEESELEEVPHVTNNFKQPDLEEVPYVTNKLKQSELDQVPHVSKNLKKSKLKKMLHGTKKLEESELEEVSHVTNHFKQPELEEVPYVTNKLKQSELDQVPHVPKNLKKPKLKEMLHGTKKLEGSELEEVPHVTNNFKQPDLEEVPYVTNKLKQSELDQVPHVPKNLKKPKLKEMLHGTKKLEGSELEEVPHVTNHFKQPELEEVPYSTNKLEQSELDQVPHVPTNLKKPKLKEVLHGPKKLEQSEVEEVSRSCKKFKKPELEDIPHAGKELEEAELEEVIHLNKNLKQSELAEKDHTTKESKLQKVDDKDEEIEQSKAGESFHDSIVQSSKKIKYQEDNPPVVLAKDMFDESILNDKRRTPFIVKPKPKRNKYIIKPIVLSSDDDDDINVIEDKDQEFVVGYSSKLEKQDQLQNHSFAVVTTDESAIPDPRELQTEKEHQMNISDVNLVSESDEIREVVNNKTSDNATEQFIRGKRESTSQPCTDQANSTDNETRKLKMDLEDVKMHSSDLPDADKDIQLYISPKKFVTEKADESIMLSEDQCKVGFDKLKNKEQGKGFEISNTESLDEGVEEDGGQKISHVQKKDETITQSVTDEKENKGLETKANALDTVSMPNTSSDTSAVSTTDKMELANKSDEGVDEVDSSLHTAVDDHNISRDDTQSSFENSNCSDGSISRLIDETSKESDQKAYHLRSHKRESSVESQMSLRSGLVLPVLPPEKENPKLKSHLKNTVSLDRNTCKTETKSDHSNKEITEEDQTDKENLMKDSSEVD